MNIVYKHKEVQFTGRKDGMRPKRPSDLRHLLANIDKAPSTFKWDGKNLQPEAKLWHPSECGQVRLT